MPSVHSVDRSPVQPLEARRLYSATLAGHVLVVTAAPGVPNTITVGPSADQASVVVTDAYATGKAARVVAHADTKAFPLSAGITLVKITGSNKPDAITVDQANGSFPVPTQVRAGGGNDTVTGGDEPDAVWGQGGADVINGGSGNDSLYGMAGADTLVGGDGNDYLSGGTGKDSLEGDGGDDTLHDPYGPDTVLAGDGANTFQIHSLSRDVTNDFTGGQDTLKVIPVPSTATDDSSLKDILLGALPFL